MSSKLSTTSAMTLLRYCQSLEQKRNPFRYDGRGGKNDLSKSHMSQKVLNDLIQDQNGSFKTHSPSHLLTSLSRCLVEIPDLVIEHHQSLDEVDIFDLLKVAPAQKGNTKDAQLKREQETIHFNFEARKIMQDIIQDRSSYLSEKQKQIKNEMEEDFIEKIEENAVKERSLGGRNIVDEVMNPTVTLDIDSSSDEGKEDVGELNPPNEAVKGPKRYLTGNRKASQSSKKQAKETKQPTIAEAMIAIGTQPSRDVEAEKTKQEVEKTKRAQIAIEIEKEKTEQLRLQLQLAQAQQNIKK